MLTYRILKKCKLPELRRLARWLQLPKGMSKRQAIKAIIEQRSAT